MPLINNTRLLASRRRTTREFVGYFNTKVNFQLVGDNGERGPILAAAGGKGKGRQGLEPRRLLNGTTITENTDKWFIGHLWSDELQNMVTLWDNPLLENTGWTESQRTDSDYPATMVFVKYVIFSTPLRAPNGLAVRDANDMPVFLHLANREDNPIVVASELSQPLEALTPETAPNYEMQDDEVPLYPFDPLTYSFLERDPMTGREPFPRAYLHRLGPNGEPEFTRMVNLMVLDNTTSSFRKIF